MDTLRAPASLGQGLPGVHKYHLAPPGPAAAEPLAQECLAHLQECRDLMREVDGALALARGALAFSCGALANQAPSSEDNRARRRGFGQIGTRRRPRMCSPSPNTTGPSLR